MKCYMYIALYSIVLQWTVLDSTVKYSSFLTFTNSVGANLPLFQVHVKDILQEDHTNQAKFGSMADHDW